jgi:hypothetical protein
LILLIQNEAVTFLAGSSGSLLITLAFLPVLYVPRPYDAGPIH